MLATQNRKALLFFAVAGGFLILLAIGLPDAFRPAVQVEEVSRQARSPFSFFQERSKGDFSWLMYVFVSLYILGLVAILFTAEGRKRFLVLGALVGLMLLLLYLFSPREKKVEQPVAALSTPEQETAGQPLPTPAVPIDMGEPPVLPDWAVVLVVILLAFMAAGIMAFFLMILGSRLRRPKSLSEEIARPVQAALDELQAGEEYQDVVLRCYARMSQVLQEARGMSREQSMTPHEFEALLVHYGFPGIPVHILTHLFEKVRYGSLTTDDQDVSLAIESLTAIVVFCQQEGEMAEDRI